jgi:predicted amidohydrolase YtcJ
MALDVALVRAKLGEERAARSYAFRSFLDAGVALAGGSDWPVVAADAFAAMRAAVARPGWDASQKLTWKEALRMYTTGAAETSALRGAVGALTRGAFADFVVVEGWNQWMDGNDEAAEASASPTRVVSTYVGGRCAHGCESAAIEH